MDTSNYNRTMTENDKNARHPRFPSLPASASKHISGAWLRRENEILDGRRSFTPDKTTYKSPPNLGPIANSVVKSTI